MVVFLEDLGAEEDDTVVGAGRTEPQQPQDHRRYGVLRAKQVPAVTTRHLQSRIQTNSSIQIQSQIQRTE